LDSDSDQEKAESYRVIPWRNPYRDKHRRRRRQAHKTAFERVSYLLNKAVGMPEHSYNQRQHQERPYDYCQKDEGISGYGSDGPDSRREPPGKSQSNDAKDDAKVTSGEVNV